MIGFLRKVYLNVYRILGFVFLGGLTGTIAYFLFLMLFFVVNNSWVAPTILSPTSDKMLQFMAGYQGAVQTVETLKVAESQSTRDLQYSKLNVRLLNSLYKDMKTYVKVVTPLENQKKHDVRASYSLLRELNTLKRSTRQSLAVHLVTNSDAAQVLSAIQTFEGATTDSATTLATLKITIPSQVVQLNEQLDQAENDIQTKSETLGATRKSLKIAMEELTMLQRSSYYDALQGGANLAFVAYDNIKVAKVGTPVYDCYFEIIGCYRVGTITHVYQDEQLVDFPLFNVRFSRTVRGVFVDMKMTRPKSMRSLILFAGHKPMFL